MVHVKRDNILAVKQWLREVALSEELPECVKEFALIAHTELCK